jgi:hypothetical protein
MSNRLMSNLTMRSSIYMARAASGTIAFVPYLLQNVLPWCSRVAQYPPSTR